MSSDLVGILRSRSIGVQRNQLSNGLVGAGLTDAVAMTALNVNEEEWIMLKSKRSLLIVVVLIVASFLGSVPVEAAPSQVRLTWMGVTSWLFEVADLRIVMDGYITRNPTQALGPDEEAIQQISDHQQSWDMRMAPGRGRGHLCWWSLIFKKKNFLIANTFNQQSL